MSVTLSHPARRECQTADTGHLAGDKGPRDAARGFWVEPSPY